MEFGLMLKYVMLGVTFVQRKKGRILLQLKSNINLPASYFYSNIISCILSIYLECSKSRKKNDKDIYDYKMWQLIHQHDQRMIRNHPNSCTVHTVILLLYRYTWKRNKDMWFYSNEQKCLRETEWCGWIKNRFDQCE